MIAVINCNLHVNSGNVGVQTRPEAFLAAAFWGGARIPDDIMHDRVSGVILHQLCDATL